MESDKEEWTLHNWKQFLLMVLLLWTLVTIIFTVRYSIYQISQGNKVHWLHIFLFNYNSAIIWVVLSPFIYRFTTRIYLRIKTWYQALFIHILLALIIAPIQTLAFLVLDFVIQNTLSLWTQKMTLQEYLASYFAELSIDAFLTYAIIVCLFLAYTLYLKNQSVLKIQAQLEKNLLQSRITNLKYQLQPHFLFNSMQTISNLMHKNVHLADKAMANLSDILRFSINQLNTDYISLDEELKITTKYLNFQKLRFDEMIAYDLITEEGLSDCQVPAILLQPLVENSIKHGFEKTGNPIEIQIRITEANNRLHIEIMDNGPGFPPDFKPKESGTGISNLINRLEYFYQDNFQFDLNSKDKGSHIYISIPLRYEKI